MKATNYGVVDFKTITYKRLSIHARGIYCYLACYANKKPYSFPVKRKDTQRAWTEQERLLQALPSA